MGSVGIMSSTGNKLESSTCESVVLRDYGFPEAPTFRELPRLSVPTVDFDDGDSCVGAIPDKFERYVVCSDCFRWRKVKPSCGQRNCPKCQKRRSRLLLERYLPALELIKTGFGRRWIAVTLTGYRIEKEHLGDHVRAFGKDAREFVKKKYLGGIITIEHTVKKESGEYYIHAHALVLGDFQNQQKLSEEWGRFVWLQDMRFDPQGHARTNKETVRAGLSYLLKYVTKGVVLGNDELKLAKGLRYVSNFGELYNMKLPRFQSRCAFCDGRLLLGHRKDIDIIIRDNMAHGSEPLKVKRVISWPPKSKKPSEYDVRETLTRAKDYSSGLMVGQSSNSGLLLRVKWLLGEVMTLSF